MLMKWASFLGWKPNCKRVQKIRFKSDLEHLETRQLPAVIFVATTGNDGTGAGSITLPYRTLHKALSVVEAGDTVTLRSGVYSGGVEVDDPSITIRSFDNEWATISAPTNVANVDSVIRFTENAFGGKLQRVEIVGGAYYCVKIDGVWSDNPFERMAATGVVIEDSRIHDTGRDAIKITPGCDDVVIRRNEIFNTGVRDSSNAEGIDNVNGDRMIVQDNYIHHTATTGVYAKGGSIGTIIDGNLITNTRGAGIQFGFRETDPEWFDTAINPAFYEHIDGVISNNVIVETSQAGIGLYGARSPSVFNNTLVNVAQVGQAALLVDSSDTRINGQPRLLVASQNVAIANNIVQMSSTSTRPMFEIRVGGLVGPLQLAGNRYFDLGNTAVFKDNRAGSFFSGGLASWTAHVSSEVGSSEGAPGLNDNFHLLPGSPCIDAGAAMSNIRDDFDGNTRVGRIDIGADEAVAGTALAVPPPSGTVGTGAGLNTPTADPQPVRPRVEFSLVSSQGLESVASIRLAVTLSAASTETVTVSYAVSGGSAIPGEDFGVGSGTLTFLPGQTVAHIPMTVANDVLDENDESVTVALSGSVNAILGSNRSHTYTIQDNDSLPKVSFTSGTASFNESIGNAMIPVRLSAISGRPVTVSYRVVRGTAKAGVDYQLASGTLTFLPGQIQKSIPISIINDVRDEDNENIVVTLSAPSNAIIGERVTSTITIVDNDSPPLVAFNLASSSVLESSGFHSVTVSLSAPSTKPVRVSYSIIPGTALGSGVDYTLKGGSLVFLPGETTKSIPIAITRDSRVEPIETFRIQLSAMSNGTLGSIKTHTVTIRD